MSYTKPNQKANRSKKNGSKGLKASSSLHINAVMPERIMRNLYYVDSNYVRSNGGANYLVYAFKINDLFDPDPLILSGSVSGFKEIMQFYLNYRVMNSKLDIKITNNEAFSLLWGIFFAPISYVGSLPNRDAALNTLENGLTTGAKILAAKGGIDKDSVQVEIPCHLVLGNATQYKSEIGYSGQGLASPTIPLYAHLVIASPTGANIALGVTTFLKMEFNTEFYGKTVLNA